MSEFKVKNGIGIIPQGTSVIETDSFYRNEDLRHIEIPEGVIYINSSAFHSCANLESVYIPDSVTFIGAHPFLGCNSLKSLIIDEKNAVYDSRYNCNAIIESKTNRLIVGCSNTKIPHDVKELSSMSFRACKTLYNITIPKTVEIIGKHAFIGCHNLSVVEFEDHTRLEGRPFAGCKKLSHTKLDSFKEIRCSVMSVPENGRLMESSVYIAYDGSLYWVLNRNYYPVISSISPEMKYLTECLMIVKVGECWQLCVPERYNHSIEYYHDHQFSSCELVASNGSTLILSDGNKLYIWASDKRELSMYYDTIEEISKWNPSYIVSRDGRYGIVNSNLEVVVDCKYEKIQTMGKYLVYSTDSLFGLMSLKGDIILQPKYSSIEEFSTQSGPLKDYLKISSEGEWGYYGHNLHRSVLLDPEFDNINFKQGWFIVESIGRIGLIDNSCTRILSCVYEEIHDFSYSQRHPSWEFLVKKDRKYGLIDGDEHVILPFQYDSIIRVFSDDYKYEYLEEYGTEDGDSIYKERSFMIHEVVYQMLRDEETVFSWSRNGYGHINLENPSCFIYICQYDGKWGVLDKDGNTLIPFEYEEIEIDKLCQRKSKDSYRTEKCLRCITRKNERCEIKETLEVILL